MTKFGWLLIALCAVLVQAESIVEIVHKEQPVLEPIAPVIAPELELIAPIIAPSLPDNIINAGRNVANEVLDKVNQFLPKIQPLAPFNEQKNDDVNTDTDDSEEVVDEDDQEEIGQDEPLIGADDLDQNKPVLGGKTDIDLEVQSSSEESSEETKSSDENVNLNEDSLNSNIVLSWFKIKRPEQIMDSENNLDDAPVRKCMMHALMRYRASVYLRTVIHLLFISGVLLIICFLAIVTLRLIKKRRSIAMTHMSNEISGPDNEINKLPFGDSLYKSAFSSNKYVRLNEQSEDSKSLPDYDETIKK